jgi:integrase
MRHTGHIPERSPGSREIRYSLGTNPLSGKRIDAKIPLAVRRVKDIPTVRFHDLRHSHATQLLLAGIHPKVCQERVGHATISTTLDLYSHATETMQEDAAEKLDAALGDAISRAAQKMSVR